MGTGSPLVYNPSDHVGPLAESLTEQDLDSIVLEELVGSLDEQLVEDYCGEKHARGSGQNRYQRAGTSTRSATTTAGEHSFDRH